METDFLRSAEKLELRRQAEENVVYLLNGLTGETRFYLDLLNLLDVDNARTRLEALADTAIFVDEAFEGPEMTHLPFREMAEWLDRQDPAVSLQDFEQAVTEIFGAGPKELVQSPEYRQDRLDLADLVLMVAISSDPSMLTVRRDLMRWVRLADLIERLAKDDETLADAGAIRRGMVKTVVLPPLLFPLPPRAGAGQCRSNSTVKYGTSHGAVAGKPQTQNLPGAADFGSETSSWMGNSPVLGWVRQRQPN